MPYRISDVMKTHSPQWVAEFVQKLQLDLIIAGDAVSDQESGHKYRLPSDIKESSIMLFDNPGYHMKDIANEVIQELDDIDISREWNEIISILDDLTWSPEMLKGYISTSKLFDQHFGASSSLADRLRENIEEFRRGNGSWKNYEEVMASGLIVDDMSNGYYGAIDVAKMRYGNVCASTYSRMTNIVKEDKNKKSELRDSFWNLNSHLFKTVAIGLSMRGSYVSSFAAESLVEHSKRIQHLGQDEISLMFNRIINRSSSTHDKVYCPREISQHLFDHMIDGSFLHDLHSKEAITGSDFKNAIDISGLDINELIGEAYHRSEVLGDNLSTMLEESGIEVKPKTYHAPSSTADVVNSFHEKEVQAQERKRALEEKNKEYGDMRPSSLTRSVDNDFSPSGS